MKKKIVSIILISFSLLSFYSFKHGEETPHGGVVKHATHGYNIEKVRGIGRMYFYLLEHDEISTVRDSKISGRIEIKFTNEETLLLNLTLKGDSETLKTLYKDKRKIQNIDVYIKYQGKEIYARF